MFDLRPVRLVHRARDHDRELGELRLLLLEALEGVERQHTSEKHAGAVQVDVPVHRIQVSGLDQGRNDLKRVAARAGLRRHDESSECRADPVR